MSAIDLLKDVNINNIPDIPFNVFLKNEINKSGTGPINIETYRTLKRLEACGVPRICMRSVIYGYEDFPSLTIFNHNDKESIIEDKRKLYNNIKRLQSIIKKYKLIPSRYGIYPEMNDNELVEYLSYIYFLIHKKNLSIDNKRGILKYLTLGVSRARIVGYILNDNFIIIPEVESLDEKYSIKKAIDEYVEENNIKITLPF